MKGSLERHDLYSEPFAAILQGKDKDSKGKEGKDKPVVDPLADKEAVMHPTEPLPVRLDSEPLDSSSQGNAEAEEEDNDDAPQV